MRVLLLSDIHANLPALEAVLAAVAPGRDFDAVWCLGDVVGYGPFPNECIERLRGLAANSLAGNHDWAVLGKLDVDDFNDEAQQAIRWTQETLSSDNEEWLAQLPVSRSLNEHDLTLVHASPRFPIWEYVVSTRVAQENMAHFKTDFCFFGHTHIPVIYRGSANGLATTTRQLEERVPLELAGKLMVNPGSVGQPRDHDPRAAYALVDLPSHTLTYYRLEYDIGKTQEAMTRAGLPPRLIARLDYGI